MKQKTEQNGAAGCVGPDGAAALPTAAIGRFLGLDPEGNPVVAFPGGPSEAEVARVAAPCPDGALEAARGREVVLLFDQGDPARPIIVGWLQDPGSTESPERRYVRVDGRVVVLEAQQEVELRCGEASISLTRDGRVTIRGKAILSDAQEMQRIRGAQVRIN